MKLSWDTYIKYNWSLFIPLTLEQRGIRMAVTGTYCLHAPRKEIVGEGKRRSLSPPEPGTTSQAYARVGEREKKVSCQIHYHSPGIFSKKQESQGLQSTQVTTPCSLPLTKQNLHTVRFAWCQYHIRKKEIKQVPLKLSGKRDVSMRPYVVRRAQQWHGKMYVYMNLMYLNKTHVATPKKRFSGNFPGERKPSPPQSKSLKKD